MLRETSAIDWFLGYENQEEVLFKVLQPSAGEEARRMQQTVATAVETSSDEMDSQPVEEQPSKKKQGAKGSAHFQWEPVKEASNHKADSSSSHFPMPPPPPPSAWPSSTTSANDQDSDSLYSMLMSWYMAGYHTGNKEKPSNNRYSQIFIFHHL